MFFIFLSLVFITVLRIPFSFSYSTDEWYTMWRIVYQKGKKYNYDTPQSIIDGFSGSPKFYYYILSLMPQRFLKPIGISFNILFDLLVAIMLTYYLYILNVDLILIALANLLFGTAPILMPVTARLKGLKARTFGLFITIAGLLLYHQIFNTEYIPNYMLLLVSILIVIGVTSSAFAMQVLFFTFLGYTLFYQSIFPISFFLITLFIAWFIPFTGVKFVLKHKINHYKWYFKNRQGTSAEYRNKFKDLLFLPIRLFRARNQAYDTIFLRNSFLIVLYSCPLIVVFFYFLINHPFSELLISKETEWLSYTVIILSVVFLLTSWKPLRFLGEAERYFEYALFFLVALLFVHPTLSSWATIENVLTFVLVHLIFVFMIFLYDNKSYFRGLQKEKKSDQDIVMFFKRDDKRRRILTIPIKLSFFLAHQLSDKDRYMYYYMFVTDNVDGFRYMENDSIKYDYPIYDLNYFKSKYKINTIVLINKHIGKYNVGEEWNEIYSNSEYTVIHCI